METGLYFCVDEVGTFIWSCLEEASDLGSVHERLKEEFEARDEILWTDLVRTVSEMRREGLVEIAKAEDRKASCT